MSKQNIIQKCVHKIYNIIYRFWIRTLSFKNFLLFPFSKGVRQSSLSLEFYKKQFVAHGCFESVCYPNNSLFLYLDLVNRYKIVECDVMFTKDNIPILCHDPNLKKVATDNNVPVDIEIRTLKLSEVRKYNFSIEKGNFVGVTTLEEVMSLCSSNNVCLELDLEKKYLGRRKYQILYSLAKRYHMLDNIIWEVSPYDFFSLASIDKNLIYQFDNTWDIKILENFMSRKKYSALIISSQWFPGIVDGDYSDVIGYGHKCGYIMKCATFNDEQEVEKLLKMDVDLITTDKLENSLINRI